MPEVAGPKQVVFVDGCRLPFRRTGSDYAELTAYDLAREVLAGILARNDLAGADPVALRLPAAGDVLVDGGEAVAEASTGHGAGSASAAGIDGVIMGAVLQNPQTTNVARDAALAAGLSDRMPAHTVTMACVSANRAIADAAAELSSGRAGLMLAGGVESLSDVPVGLGKGARRRLLDMKRAKTARDYLGLLRGLRPADLLPRAPAIAEYSTGETMGESADRLAAAFGVSRAEQDAYALRSHQAAARATRDGLLTREMVPVAVPPHFRPLEADNTIRADTSPEKLAGLPPAFVKPFGTITAGNSSPLTDGAAVTLLASRSRASQLGLKARAVIRDWVFTAQDPGAELLLGPAYAVPKLLQRNGLDWHDLDVIEIHEAFAGQVLAVLAALQSDRFARERLGLSRRVAEVELERINPWGGSLSLGHPFGATGARLVTTAVSRLEAEDGELALVTACAAGGLGHAMLLERA
jgi:acetyl-CoA acetyltransferase family protein